ncbi:MAG: prolyl oligopeptidase family serine peptidase [Sedimentisphaerales bacterium]|nr:prolyl oligopeptidase family serine peptidase [Sedimentisphaerales bacterium]
MKLRQFETLEQWQAHRERLKMHILVSTGLWPAPPKTPLNARVFDTIEHDDYTVSKVQLESRPGLYVCGNLYRPVGRDGPFSGILCPHGHWQQGRFGETKDGSIRSRLISLARQGHVVFSWSMVGYNESQYFGHRFHDDAWGFNLMGLQLWNSIRACDWLCSLDDVDPQRIGCTGASGGGTQTFMLTAVDDRIRAAAPVNMISAIMQGGCECENAPLLRLETNNVEIASLAAPRPLLMVSATGDWTKNTLELEYPAVRRIYELYQAQDQILAVRHDAGHNYNLDSRNSVYPFFARTLLNAEHPEQFQEKPLTIDPEEDLLVFTPEHRPANAVSPDQLRAYLIEESRQLLDSLTPEDPTSLNRFREIYGIAYEHIVNAECPRPDEVAATPVDGPPDLLPKSNNSNLTVRHFILERKGTGQRIPLSIWQSTEIDKGQTPAAITLLIHPQGRTGLIQSESGQPIPLVRQLCRSGQAVISIDCFLTGEFLSADGKAQRPRADKHDLTYNRTDLAERIQDILTAVAFCHSRAERINLVGLERAGLWCLLARPLARDVHKTVADADQFDPGTEAAWQSDMLIPGLRRIGGLQTAAILTAPGELLIHNTGSMLTTETIRQSYRLERSGQNFRARANPLRARPIVEFLSD